jgi:hypothetical protein
VADESRTPYETWLKNRFRKFAEGMLKEDPALRSVIATRVIYGGVKEPEANAYVSYVTDGVPKPPTELRGKVAKQLFDKSYEDFLAEARPLRKRLGQTLSVRVAGTPQALAEGDVVRLDFKKVTPGRMQDYAQLERDYQPLREAQVKAGSMKMWNMSILVLPGGTEREFDAYTVHVGKDLEQVLNWGRNTGGIAAQMNPPFNLAGLTARATDLQKIVRSETRIVVMLVNR